MSINQGTVVVNTAYFTSMAERAQAAKSCAELQAIYTNVTDSVNGTLDAINSQVAAVTGQVSQMADQISKLTTHIGTLAATQAASTGVSVQAATAAAVNNLGSAIAYIQAQGPVLMALGNTNTATLIEQALALNSDLTAITDLYDIVVVKLANLQDQVTGITSELSTLQSAISAAASNFPGCSV